MKKFVSSRRSLLIIGAGGHGRVAADIAMKMKKWNQIAFLDDDISLKSSMGIDVIGISNDLYKYLGDYDFFVAIGNNAAREKIFTMLEKEEAGIATLIHPTAIIGESVEILPGTVIMAGVTINCCCRIGKGCIINTGATIDHDDVIEDYVHISPGTHLAGKVKVGKGTWLGIGSVISNNVNIVNGCIIGAGAVVVRDLAVPGTYIGIPAKKIS